ncbi:MAG: hypothetical protein ACUVTQ_02990 [Desulfotomaculales bacterium]
MCFRELKRQIYRLLPNLKYRSALGELVREIKMFGTGLAPGVATIRVLEANGLGSIRELVGKTVEDLVALGVKRSYAEAIVSYIARRRGA